MAWRAGLWLTGCLLHTNVLRPSSGEHVKLQFCFYTLLCALLIKVLGVMKHRVGMKVSCIFVAYLYIYIFDYYSVYWI